MSMPDTFSHEQHHHHCQHMYAELRKMRRNISQQSEANFVLERNLRELDRRIGLLVSQRIAVEELDTKLTDSTYRLPIAQLKSIRLTNVYGCLFYLLQTTPRYIAMLVSHLSISQIEGT